jgi:hypothetical protein
MTKVEVFFEVTADDPDLALSVLEMLNKGAKAQWGKKRLILVGTPKDEVPDNAIVIAPLNIRRLD